MRNIRYILLSLAFVMTGSFAHETDLSHITGHMNSVSWTLVDKAKAKGAPGHIKQQAAELARKAYRLDIAVKKRHSSHAIWHKYQSVSRAYFSLNHKLRTTRFKKYSHLQQQISNVRMRYSQLRDVMSDRGYRYDEPDRYYEDKVEHRDYGY